MNKAKTKQRERVVNNDSYESADGLGSGLINAFKNDVAKGISNDLWEQLLATSDKENNEKAPAGDMAEGQEISFKKKKAQQEAKKTQETVKRVDAGIDYAREIIHAERRIRAEGNQVLSVRIEEIVIELKRLTKESKALESQFREVTAMVMPKEVGKYHQNFFEWMLTVVKTARMRVENAEQWLKTVSGKGKKKDFWGMYKKHGTSFGLSSERGVAQQTG
jgi:hypothetical protein